MLAKLESTLPAGPFWRYEPKLDGFRGLLWRSDDGLVRLLSRKARDLVTAEPHAPRLVLGLRHGDDVVRHLGVTGAIPQAAAAPILELLDRAGPLEAAIPSRWQHDAVPPWRRVPPELVCEVARGQR